MDGRKFYIKDHGDTVTTNHATCVYVLFRSILKSEPGAVQYCRLRVDYLSKMKFPTSCGLTLLVSFWSLKITS